MSEGCCKPIYTLLVASCLGATIGQAQLIYPSGQAQQKEPVIDRSHSQHGKAFNTGPRQLARLIPNIGNAHFPITTKNPEAQKFFDQGLNMLYTFWWYEAERAFRQVLNLEPDSPIAYWGLAFADSNGYWGGGRSREFLDLAVKHIDKASERERLYIEAFDALMPPTLKPGDPRTQVPRTSPQVFREKMELLMEKYPDDLEAKVLYASNYDRIGFSERQVNNPHAQKEKVDELYNEILRINPMHTGVNHYRIHLWDYADPRRALNSCKPLAEAAPNVGHALHMPGHIYSGVGMWNEAVDAMDAGSRLERKYMMEQGRMPFHTWNYGHNQSFLIFNLGFAGRIREMQVAADELDMIPRSYGNPWGTSEGQMRVFMRGEQWDKILSQVPANNPDGAPLEGYVDNNYFLRGMAYIGKGDYKAAKAEYDLYARRIQERTKGQNPRNMMSSGSFFGGSYISELNGLVKVYNGEEAEGFKLLEQMHQSYKRMGSDPTPYAAPSYLNIAKAYAYHKRYDDAEKILLDGLKDVHPGDPFAQALLADLYVTQNRTDEAIKMYQTAAINWNHADSDLPALVRLQKLMKPILAKAGVQPWSSTPNDPNRLAKYGPDKWRPFPAKDFLVTLGNGKKVDLKAYKGKNLLLVFYLGGQCAHCLEQLEGLGKLKPEFSKLGTEILAVSSDSLATCKAFLEDNPNYPLALASDPSLKAAKDMAAYDEFENLELHATLLIDKKGRVWWYDSGSAPFMQLDFLKAEVVKMNKWQTKI